MTKVIKIGRLRLDMGSVSHVIGFNANNLDLILRYSAYQNSFEK